MRGRFKKAEDEQPLRWCQRERSLLAEACVQKAAELGAGITCGAEEVLAPEFLLSLKKG